MPSSTKQAKKNEVPSAESSTKLPKCVVFDLDYTLWDLWIDTHISPPLHLASPGSINHLKDRRNQSLGFYPEVPELLFYLRAEGVHVAAASRTSAPELAREALSLLLLSPPTTSSQPDPTLQKALSLFQTLEIYPGSKLRHFREIKRKTGIRYEDMLFFDDESRNKEVEQLGVTMHLIHNGVNKAEWEKGLREWRRRRAAAD